MKQLEWLLLEVVLETHSENIRLFGGSHGVRNIGFLESALMRPRNLLCHEPDSRMARLAAAYAAGIILNHPFIDGNKRTGFLAAYAFLRINGYPFTSDEAVAAAATLELAAGNLSETDYAAWLDECVAPYEKGDAPRP